MFGFWAFGLLRFELSRFYFTYDIIKLKLPVYLPYIVQDDLKHSSSYKQSYIMLQNSNIYFLMNLWTWWSDRQVPLQSLYCYREGPVLQARRYSRLLARYEEPAAVLQDTQLCRVAGARDPARHQPLRPLAAVDRPRAPAPLNHPPPLTVRTTTLNTIKISTLKQTYSWCFTSDLLIKLYLKYLWFVSLQHSQVLS